MPNSSYIKFHLIFFLFVLFIETPLKAQQDVQFSQYVFNGLSVNPAYAGYKRDWNLNTTERQQWVGFPGAPMTATISFDGLTGARNENMGIGGQFTYDKLGPQQVLSFYGSYAYRLQLNDDDDRLSFGLGLGATQYSINIAELKYNDANDPVIPAGSANKIKPDINFGIYYSTTDFYVGASALNLSSFTKSNSVYYSDNAQYPSIEKAVQLYLTGGWVTDLTDQIKFKPSIMLKEDFRAPTAVDFNSFLLFADRLWIGGSYRRSFQIWHKSNLQPNLDANNAASGIVQFYATPTIRIGYAYDFTTSGLSSYQSGTHEISIGITFPSSKRSELLVDPRYF